MNVNQNNLAKELSIIQQLLQSAHDEIEKDDKELALKHFDMATSRLGTLYVLLKEGD